MALPEGWKTRFPCDVNAPSVGTWMGVSKLFILRGARRVGRDASESLHPTLVGSMAPAGAQAVG
ncbi:hypothetical protein KU6B_17800 [Mameliella alba]|nr:hypothetical protein KU6B_17800 [Mameliella alba]